MEKWLHNDNISMYLIHNEGKSVFAKRLKAKIYKI